MLQQRTSSGYNVTTSDITPTDGDVLTWSSAANAYVALAPSGGGAPTTSQYVTLATDATLTNERVLTAGTGISITDAGAGSTVTIAATGTGGLTSPQVLARSLGS